MYDCHFEEDFSTPSFKTHTAVTLSEWQLQKQFSGRSWARFSARHHQQGSISLARLRTIALHLGLELRPLADGSLVVLDIAASEIFAFNHRFGDDLLISATICRKSLE